MKSNVAYDLNSFSQDSYAPSIRVLKVKTAKKEQALRKKNKINLVMVLEALILIFFMALTVNSRTRLIEVQTDVNNATTELNALKSENAYYNYQLESMVSLKSIEDYARNELGLIKRDSNQVTYIKLNDQNKIEVAKQPETGYEQLKEIWNSVIDLVVQ